MCNADTLKIMGDHTGFRYCQLETRAQMIQEAAKRTPSHNRQTSCVIP